MTYAFPPDVEQLVAGRMATGGYSTEDDVLRDALRALAEEEEDLAAVRRPLPSTARVIPDCRSMKPLISFAGRGPGRRRNDVSRSLTASGPHGSGGELQSCGTSRAVNGRSLVGPVPKGPWAHWPVIRHAARSHEKTARWNLNCGSSTSAGGRTFSGSST